MLQVILHGFSRGKSHGKIYAVIFYEIRHQLLSVGIECDAENLEALWAIIFLNAAQNLSGVLAVWSSGEHEREQHYFAGILTEQHLAAAVHADGKLGGGPRHLLSESYSGDKPKAERGKRMMKSHTASLAQRASKIVGVIF